MRLKHARGDGDSDECAATMVRLLRNGRVGAPGEASDCFVAAANTDASDDPEDAEPDSRPRSPNADAAGDAEIFALDRRRLTGRPADPDGDDVMVLATAAELLLLPLLPLSDPRCCRARWLTPSAEATSSRLKFVKS